MERPSVLKGGSVPIKFVELLATAWKFKYGGTCSPPFLFPKFLDSMSVTEEKHSPTAVGCLVIFIILIPKS